MAIRSTLAILAIGLVLSVYCLLFPLSKTFLEVPNHVPSTADRRTASLMTRRAGVHHRETSSLDQHSASTEQKKGTLFKWQKKTKKKSSVPALSPSNCNQEPCNVSIVMVGDSLTRFMYISLTYYLRHGKWLDPDARPSLVVPRDYSFGDSSINWFLPWYRESMSVLAPYDNCDCYRHKVLNSREGFEALCENRYYHDPFRNNTVIWFSAWGTKLHLRGHWTDPLEAMTAPRRRSIFKTKEIQRNGNTGAEKVGPQSTNYTYSWRHTTWAGLIRDQVAKVSPNALILNAGLWWNKFDNPAYAKDVLDAAQEIGVPNVIWRTTTSGKQGSYETLQLDRDMCHLFPKCLNVSGWTSQLSNRHYADRLHFREPIYRKMNEQLLDVLGITHSKSLQWSDIGVGAVQATAEQ